MQRARAFWDFMAAANVVSNDKAISHDRRLRYAYGAQFNLMKVYIDFPCTCRILELQSLFNAEINRRNLRGIFLQSTLRPGKPSDIAVVGYGSMLEAQNAKKTMLSIATFVLETMERISPAAAKRP